MTFNRNNRSSGGFRSGSGGGFKSRNSQSNRFRGGSQSGNRGGRGGFRGRGPGSRRGGNGGGRRGRQDHIDHNRFINKVVTIKETEKFVPQHQFADFAVHADLKKNVLEKGYVTPTPIQDRSIPHILQGKDVVGIAQTGTGKTAAFLLPLINKVLHNRSEKILIMVPTRELATQINSELFSFVRNLRIFSVCCVGGMNIGAQIHALKDSYNFIIGTPGRLKDLINRKRLNLNEFKTVVLDESDRMLDMGFIGDMKFIMSLMPTDRHTLFFSATISHEVENLIKDFLRDPVRIQISARPTSDHIHQDVVKIPKGGDKVEVLKDLLAQPGFDKVLIFGRTKHGVDRLSKKLNQLGFKSESIHGDKTQGRRLKALSLFKRDHVNILVATDVAARGLDIAGVSHVINFDIPATHEDYVHRIGRTGRAGKPGQALTFIEV